MFQAQLVQFTQEQMPEMESVYRAYLARLDQKLGALLARHYKVEHDFQEYMQRKAAATNKPKA